MKFEKRFFLIAGIVCLLLSLTILIVSTEIEYENLALCIYIDYAFITLSTSIVGILAGILFLVISKNIDDDDFSHIVRKY
jgi:hypothetical protein